MLSPTVWGNPAWLTFIFAVLAAAFFAGGGLYWHATVRGKFQVWEELFACAPAPVGVLDMGCSHGALVIPTAARFPEARVEGVDLWRSIDQSGNSPEAAEVNARENGVAGRIRFVTGDMTQLPVPDAEFDLVTAGLSIHKISSAEGRAPAIDEAWRVLRPGGRLLIPDFPKTCEYERRLVELGAHDLVVRDAVWRVWWRGP